MGNIKPIFRSLAIFLLLIVSFASFGQAKYRHEIQDYATVSALRAESTIVARKNDKVFVRETKHLYYFDPTSSLADEGDSVIWQVNQSGRWRCISCFQNDQITQEYFPIVVSGDTTGYENVTYLNGVEVDRDTVNLVEWNEKRICLNATTFIPADINNPTILELQTWVQANLSLKDQTNGTHVVYFVNGDGGSCDDPDFTWVLNKGSELITEIKNNHYRGKTFYLSPTGNDGIARFGEPRKPFKRFDLLKQYNSNSKSIEVGEGVYDMDIYPDAIFQTSDDFFSLSNKKYNYHLKEGSILNISKQGTVWEHSANSDLTITGDGTINIIKNDDIEGLYWFVYNNKFRLQLDTFRFLNNGLNSSNGLRIVNKDTKLDINSVFVKNAKDYYYPIAFGNTWGLDHTTQKFDVNIKSIDCNQESSFGASGIVAFESISSLQVQNAEININIDNVHIYGNGRACTFFYALANYNNINTNVRINNILNTSNGNITLLGGPAMLYDDYEWSSNNNIYPEISLAGGASGDTYHNNLNVYLGNVNTTGTIFSLNGSHFLDNSKVNLECSNGTAVVACCTVFDPRMQNSNTWFKGNYTTTGENPCILVGAAQGLDANSNIRFSGVYRTLSTSKATMQISSYNNSNTIILENCTLINGNTVPNITTNATVPITVICKNVYMSSTLNDPNIILLGDFVQDPNLAK